MEIRQAGGGGAAARAPPSGDMRAASPLRASSDAASATVLVRGQKDIYIHM